MAERKGARSTDRFQKKREAILDTSTILLNEHGVKGLTLAVAASAVGLSTTSVTYYFKRKDDLAAACIMRGLNWLLAAVETSLVEATPQARLHKLLELYLERLRLTAVGEAPSLPALSDIRALNNPQRTEVFEAFIVATALAWERKLAAA